MKNTRLFFLTLSLALGIFLGLLLPLHTSEGQKQDNDNQFEQVDGFIVHVKAMKNDTKVIDADIFLKEEISIMDLMKQYFDVETAYDDKFIMSIDGIAPEDVTKESWMIYVNGEMALKGATDIMLKKGDKLEFKYEKF